MNFTYDTFMSHSSKDKDEVSFLRTVLGKDFTVWFAYEGIEGSDKWVKAISKGITNSAVFLVFWTKNASESEWVEREILKALEQDKPVIPMLFDDTPLGLSLIDTQAIDFRGAYSEALGKLGRKIRDYTEIPSQELSSIQPWKYESKPSPSNNFFYQNGYLDPSMPNFASNTNTQQLYANFRDDKPLTRFVTLVVAPVPHALKPVDLPFMFESPEVISSVHFGPKTIGKPEPDCPWRWFNLVDLKEKPAHQEFLWFYPDPQEIIQGPFPTLAYLRFTENGAIEYAPRGLAFTSTYRQPETSGFRLVSLLGEVGRFLGLTNTIYNHRKYRGDFQLLINLVNTRNTLLADFAPGWSNEDFLGELTQYPWARPSLSQAANMQVVYRINAGALSQNVDMIMDLVDELSGRIQNGFGLQAEKRHLDKSKLHFPWEGFLHSRYR